MELQTILEKNKKHTSNAEGKITYINTTVTKSGEEIYNITSKTKVN